MRPLRYGFPIIGWSVEGSQMNRDAEIRDLAYHLWEEAGRPGGRDQEFWLRAEAGLTGTTPPAKPAKPGPAAKKTAAPRKTKAK